MRMFSVFLSGLTMFSLYFYLLLSIPKPPICNSVLDFGFGIVEL